MNPTDNSQFEQKPTIEETDKLASELCAEYSNPGFYRWYCKVINTLGIQRVNEIRAMYSDAKHARHLFSRRASEEMKVRLAEIKLLELRHNHGKDKD